MYQRAISSQTGPRVRNVREQEKASAQGGNISYSKLL